MADRVFKILSLSLLVLTLGCGPSVKETHNQNSKTQTKNQSRKSTRKNVAILIFDGVQIIDFTGPYEVFGQAGYHVFTVSENRDTITTHMKMDVIPAYTLYDHPKADIIVVPGGGVPHRLPKENEIIQWINNTSTQADYILSVCNGAFFLASAGLLDNKEATTYAPMINHIVMYAPKTKPVYDKRFVQSDNVITAGGLSAGIDAALHVVALDMGQGRATEVANNMEYNWDPESGYVRSGLADMQLVNVLDFNPPLMNKKVIAYEGDDTYWICEYEVVRNETLLEFYDQFRHATSMYKWQITNESVTEDAILTDWEFTDFDKRNWTCQTRFSSTTDNKSFRLFIHLKRK